MGDDTIIREFDGIPRLKVMIVVGTRPEIIRLSRIIDEADRVFDLVLVHTGQNFDYELSEVFFKDLGVRKPDHMLGVSEGTIGERMGAIIARSEAVIARERPDALLVLGDTNSGLCVIPAKRHKVPIFHMEAGNRCFDMRVPEEINRKIIDHVSDINLTYTEHARRYLLSEGLRPETVIKTGSPMREVIEHFRPRIEGSDVLTRLGLEPRRYFVVSAHREENVDDPDRLRTLLRTLDELARRAGQRVIVSTHARTRQRLDALPGADETDQRIEFLKPLGFFDYVALQMRARCVLSDSGTITEESAMLGFPAVTLREAHERPEGMDVGTLVMCGLSAERVLDAVRLVVSQHERLDPPPTLPHDYERTDVSRQVTRVIAGYVGYVNRTVWSKPGAL